MEYYRDAIESLDPQPQSSYTYHYWTPESIARFWKVFVQNPFLQRQFYPSAFWRDLVDWCSSQMMTVPSSIADVGCGSGALLAELAAGFPSARLTGIDIPIDSLSYVEKNMPSDHRSRISFTEGQLPALPVQDRTLDLVTCTEVMEHLEPEVFEAAFAEFARVLTSGGTLLLTMPFEQPMHLMVCPECSTVFTPNQHLQFEITRKDLQTRLTTAGFSTVIFYDPLDRSRPTSPYRRVLKTALLKFPFLARRVLSTAGVTGVLAIKG